MDEILRKRLERKLEGLPDEKAYQVLDYIEFLESKYGSTSRDPTPIERIAEGVGDTLRAARAPAAAIRGTMSVMDTASRLMRGLVAAGKAAVDEIRESVAGGTAPAAPESDAPKEPPKTEEPKSRDTA